MPETDNTAGASRRNMLKTGAAVGGATWMAPAVLGIDVASAGVSPVPGGGCVCIDFDDVVEGANVSASQPYAGLGVTLSSQNDATKPLVIFDSANPTGGDVDLGTPNQDFGGPGIGAGGKAGTPGENKNALGHVLIVNEDTDLTDPDDNWNGGTITIDFADPVLFLSIDVLDVESTDTRTITLKDSVGTTLQVVAFQSLGDNSFQSLTIDQDGVSQAIIAVSTSFAVAEFCFCPTER